MKRFIVAALLILTSAICFANGAKIYTRKARLEDFTSKTIKVILGGDAFLQATLREEVSRRWYLSPFEFSTPQEYEKLKNSNEFYFLRTTTLNGIIFLTITKSGKPDDKNLLNRGFDVISFPLANEHNPSAHEILYLSAYIDILQKYMEQAITYEGKAYLGFEPMNKAALTGRKVLVECDEADKIFVEDTPGYACGVSVSSADSAGGNAVCYRIVVSADTHQLCYFKKHKISDKSPKGFLDQDIKLLNALSRK